MICKECQAKNITKAQFCQHCGSAFTDEDRQNAYDRTIFGMIDKLEEWKGYATLEFITGHPVFKTAVLVLILLWGLWLGRSNGNAMTILEGDTYRVQQNTDNGDYYILTEENQVPLNLYLPRQADLTLQVWNADTMESQYTFAVEDEILLEVDTSMFFIIEADYGQQYQQIKLYVLPES